MSALGGREDMFRALQNRNYRLYLIGNSVSLVGTHVQNERFLAALDGAMRAGITSCTIAGPPSSVETNAAVPELNRPSLPVSPYKRTIRQRSRRINPIPLLPSLHRGRL